MARGRMINQTIDYDPEFNALSAEAQLIYLRTLAFLDRDGLIIGHPRGLLARVAPLMEYIQPHMPDIINEWVMEGLVIRYTLKIGDVLFFKGFSKNQSGMHYDRETSSRFDPPPGWTHGPKGLIPLESEPTPTPPASSQQTESSETPAQPESSVQTESGNPPDEVRQESGDSPAQIESKDQDQLEDQLNEKKEDDEDTQARARDAIHAAWFETYHDELPENLEKPVAKLLKDTSEAAVIHGIRQSVNSESRSFRFIGECARNYIPPAPPPQNANYTNGYHVEGVYKLEPAERSTPPPELPAPMAHDDPWAQALAELMPTLPGKSGSWLEGSQLVEDGELAGVPLYRVMVLTEPGNIGWLTQQAEPAVRKKLSSILRKRIMVNFVAASVPTIHGATA